MELAHQAKAEPVERSQAHPFGGAAKSLRIRLLPCW